MKELIHTVTKMSYGFQSARKVKIRADRVCKVCGRVMPKGTSCVTVSSNRSYRCWYHSSCYKAYIDRLNDLSDYDDALDSVPFGDEGAAQYYIDAIHEAEGMLDLDY